jgi:hypothetical protein
MFFTSKELIISPLLVPCMTAETVMA